MLVLDVFLWNITDGASIAVASIIFTFLILCYAIMISFRFQILLTSYNLQVKDLKKNAELKKRYKQELAEKGRLHFFKMKHGNKAAVIYWSIILVLMFYMVFIIIYENETDKKRMTDYFPVELLLDNGRCSVLSGEYRENMDTANQTIFWKLGYGIYIRLHPYETDREFSYEN